MRSGLRAIAARSSSRPSTSSPARCARTASARWSCGPRCSRAPRKLVILVELRGGNDGLNTVVPFADPLYARFRPRLALDRERLVDLDTCVGLHPSLEKLGDIWFTGELAVVQGVGYPQANLSH